MNFKKVANIALTIVLLISGSQVAIKVYDYKKSEETYNEIQEIVEPPTENYTIIESLNAYEKLKTLNEDYQFWIEIENTNVNYPVVQTTDNSFYLKKDFYKKDSSSGTIFMDTLNNFYLDNNIVLYGHNMNNKTMFNNLVKYKKEEFFNENNKIKIKNTADGREYIYEVFSAYHTDNSFDYNTVRFSDTYSFSDYIKDIKSKSLFKKQMDINSTDQVLTLSTCSYEFKNAKTTIHAKLIEVIDLNEPKDENGTQNNEKNEQLNLEEENNTSISDMLEE